MNTLTIDHFTSNPVRIPIRPAPGPQDNRAARNTGFTSLTWDPITRGWSGLAEDGSWHDYIPDSLMQNYLETRTKKG